MIQTFVMTEKQRSGIMEASKPVPYLVFGGIPPRSPQENANEAWSRLGDHLGFEYNTVRPLNEGDADYKIWGDNSLVFRAKVKRPPEPTVEPHTAWYRCWECGRDDMAAFFSDEPYIAYKGGCDIDAEKLSAKTWDDLMQEIDDAEEDCKS